MEAILIRNTELELYGKKYLVETGKLAKQASGAVTVRCGDTIVLVTAVQSKEPREGIDFFPLTVDIEEKMYAAGKIPGGYIKREGRPTEASILTARLIDRPLRPCFPKGYHNDVQIIATALSSDGENPADILMLIGASFALSISNIPFTGPVAAVRVGRINGEIAINPTHQELENSDFDIVVAGTKEAILMVEAGANIIPDEDILAALLRGHQEIKKFVAWQEAFAAEVGTEKSSYEGFVVDSDVEAAAVSEAGPAIAAAIRTEGKKERIDALSATTREYKKKLKERFPDKSKDIDSALGKVKKEQVRKMILDEGVRVDGRALNEVRQIACETGLLPRTHGSGLFTRGETQVLSILTLGSVSDEQRLDGLLSIDERKRFMHHYNFPPFSTGEAYPLRGPKRREIGHGALAERAQVPVLPSAEDFPYTIRIVSEALESNGSTSMASVCGSNLALMDAGVPVKEAVAGVAMGLVKEGDKIAVLTDILGMEDALGDMDFKVAGTKDGITALQMDMKIAGIDEPTLKLAIERAKEGRLHILGKMAEAITIHRNELSEFAPKIISLKIDIDKIGELIGPKGKNIKGIQEQTGCTIDIKDDGTVLIGSVSAEGLAAAEQMVIGLTKTIKPGEVYEGTIVGIKDFGCFVELLPGKDGLLHISKLGVPHGQSIESKYNFGDRVTVRVNDIDKMGRVSLVLDEDY